MKNKKILSVITIVFSLIKKLNNKEEKYEYYYLYY